MCKPKRRSLERVLTFGFLVAFGPSACASTGPYVWVDDLPKSAPDDSYVIGPGDTISIHVWNHDKLTGKALVRPDGRISLPFLRDIEVGGRTPMRLAWELEAKLKDYVVNPTVHVAVEEQRPLTVSVMGEVSKPGAYPVGAGAGVMHALAAAGGLTDFADKKRIFVLRQGEKVLRIRFAYEALARAVGQAPSFRLQAGDVVVVE